MGQGLASRGIMDPPAISAGSAMRERARIAGDAPD
jgi:hypothetical protein